MRANPRPTSPEPPATRISRSGWPDPTEGSPEVTRSPRPGSASGAPSALVEQGPSRLLERGRDGRHTVRGVLHDPRASPLLQAAAELADPQSPDVQAARLQGMSRAHEARVIAAGRCVRERRDLGVTIVEIGVDEVIHERVVATGHLDEVGEDPGIDRGVVAHEASAADPAKASSDSLAAGATR